jgi:putative ABC transport system permease protein
MQDLKYAVRQLLKSPGFTIVAVLTLTLGIGANTAIFSIISAILLHPLPYSAAERVVQVDETPNTGGYAGSCGGVFMDWEDHATQLESIAAFAQSTRNLTGEGEPVRLLGLEVTGNYLNVLRVAPALGRGFTLAEDAPGGDRHVAILSHELWQARFNGSPSVVGRAIQLDGDSYTVIGILPPHALFASSASYLIPATIRADGYKQSRDYNYPCQAIGRLKPGATIVQASAEFTAAKRALASSYPAFKQPWGVAVRPLQEALFGGAKPFTFTLFAAVALVLLIACVNVANLLLAKATTRQGEIAIRLALGAGRGRIVRQLLTESLLLAVAGGFAGIWLGKVAIAPLTAFTGLAGIPGLTVAIDGRVLAFTLVATFATGLLFGLLPALSATRLNLQANLKEGTRGSSGGSGRRLQSLLIVSETALTVVLLSSAGLLLRSFVKALNSDPGFNRENVLIFTLTQPGSKAPTNDHRVRFTREILEHLAQIPGVSRVGEVSSTPMNGNAYYGDLVSREDRPETRNDRGAGFDSVNGDFFQSLGIPLLRGRFFTEADDSEKAPKTIIINDALSRRLFAAENPVGRLLHFKDAAWEIVGVVGNIRRFQLDVDPVPQVYYPQVYFPWATTYVVRAHLPPLTLAADVRRAVHAVDPEQPIAGLQTLEQSVTDSLRGRRVMLSLLGIFAGTALALACVGIYGVMAYSVAQRTREMGIRLALGADARKIVSLILGDGLRIVAIGLGLGTLGSLGAGVLIYSQLYNATTSDPIVVSAVVALVLLSVALFACWLPARRAMRVDPLVALRAE